MIHNSNTCQLGPNGGPCEMCQWSNEQSNAHALVENVIKNVVRDLDLSPDVASMSTIRAALFDVFDANVKELYAHDCKDHLVTDEQVAENRYAFVDAIIARIGDLQRDPHNFDSDLSARYQRGYADGWADANVARLKEENADLREMARAAQERF